MVFCKASGNMEGEYRVKFAGDAEKQLERLERSGRKAYLKKAFALLAEIAVRPRAGTGSPEHLRHQKEGKEVWSRRVNRKDRIVYHISEDERMILVTQVLGHYDDR